MLVFDFGGGTLDITIARLAREHMRVLASGGIDLAGSDFDRLIIQRRLLRFFGQGQLDAEPELKAMLEDVQDWMALPEQATPANRHRLRQAAQSGLAPVELGRLESLIFEDQAFSFYRMVEDSKIELSSKGSALARLKQGGLDLWMLYTRTQFENDIQEALGRVRQLLLEVVGQAGLTPDAIQAVVATGGSSAIPAFQAMLGEVFGPRKLQLTSAFTSVAAGLALRGAQLGELPSLGTAAD